MSLLEVKGLKKYFPIKRGLLKRTKDYVRAVNDVSFTLDEKRTLGIVGESGSGKSTLGRVLLGLMPATDGEVFFKGKPVLNIDKDSWRGLRRDMQIIFQDPYGSLNPRRTVREIIREPLDTHAIGDKAGRDERVKKLLETVSMRPQVMHRYPHEFSGGQRQRISIARSLALNPSLIVADEPVSALDVSVQSQVLNLIKELQDEFGIAFIFISHDLAVVQHISHDVGVMYFGELVELTSAINLYREPKHPYTELLLKSVPQPETSRKAEKVERLGDIPSHSNPPSGCPFHPRCPHAMDVCKRVKPLLTNIGDAREPHYVSCHLHTEAQV